MRALPQILERRPEAQIVIVGSDGVSYGRAPVGAPNWRQRMLSEVGTGLDMSRVHFVGRLAYEQYLAVLQLSSVHLYLTYPFVLSWSLLEAMAAGCVVVGSRTPPIEEVIDGASNGFLVDFFDVDGLANQVCSVLSDRAATEPIRENARRTVVRGYDLRRVCLPAHLALIDNLAGSKLAAPAAEPRDPRAGPLRIRAASSR
jgi:glycosyltransferase involved in cell wall biosynthesis